MEKFICIINIWSPEVMESSDVSARIHREIFQLMADPFLRKHLLIGLIPPQPVSILLHAKHFISQSSEIIDEQIVINYPAEYPYKPFSITVCPDEKYNIQIPSIVTECSEIRPQNWKETTKIKEILTKIIKSLDIYWNNIYHFGKNLTFNDIYLNKKQKIQQKMQQNHQLTSEEIYPIQKSNLALILRFEEVSLDLQKQQIQQSYICLQLINQSKKNNISTEQLLNKLLSYHHFRQQIKKQLANGQWINKILKCGSGMIYKKYLLSLISQLAATIQLFQQMKAEQNGQSQKWRSNQN